MDGIQSVESAVLAAPGLILGLVIILVVVVLVARSVRVVSQATALVVERLGKFHSVLPAGLHIIIPVIDNVRARVDLREQVVAFQPQSVITSDNVMVSIDSVVYYQITDPVMVTYEIANYIAAIEQLTATTLRNVIGTMNMDQALVSRDTINRQLSGVLDEATGKWGIKVSRVELKTIEPSASIQKAMEQQMRAEREKRATVLTAQGVRESQILEAEGEKQSAILRAEGEAQAAITRAQGEAEAIAKVFGAIHAGNPDPKLLAYQYLQMLPQLSKGESNKVWVVPTELTAALKAVTEGFNPRP